MLEMILSSHSKGDSTMFPLSRNFLKFAAAGAIVALTAVSTPAHADEMVQNLGPVGPHEPMIATVGGKRVIAFFVPGNGNCNIQAVIWNSDSTDGADTAAGFRVGLKAGQTASLDSADNKSLTLRCGDYAETLAAVDDTQSIASNVANK
jgi:hypothetical protein